MKTISANGLQIPILGQGGWNIGDDPRKTREESAALRRGIDLGLTLIDTAEMYGDGKSELLIGNALRDISRDEYMLVTKVLPHNAGKSSIYAHCDASLKRLRTDYIDLYLLHWRGDIPLEETVGCMQQLVRMGKIRRWGVSNFDVSDMEDLWRVPDGKLCAVDQVLYHIDSRGIEFDLIPWLSAHGLAVMAYCPLAQAGTLKRMQRDILGNRTLMTIASKHTITVTQLLLAFTIRRPNLSAIPKAGSLSHVEENAATAGVQITAAEWAEVDAVFWPPTAKMHLDIE